MSRDNLEGKVGRMYVPRQEVDTMPLRKMKVSLLLPWQQSIMLRASPSQDCLLNALPIALDGMADGLPCLLTQLFVDVVLRHVQEQRCF